MSDYSTQRPPVVKTLFKAVRAHQWVKNLLLFVPPLAVHQFGNLSDLIVLVIALELTLISIPPVRPY